MSHTKNNTLKKRRKLSHTLLFWFLLLALLPMALTAWISYQQAVRSLTASATEQLTQDAKRNARFINNWFDYRFMDLTLQADSRRNTNLLINLKSGFHTSHQGLADFTKSFRWAMIVDEPKTDLINLTKDYDYIYDILLIDDSGNVLFTIGNKSDLGENLFTGTLSNSHLTKTVKATLESGRSHFSDLGYYPPTQRLAGFITAPMIDEQGEKIGVFAIQLRIERINELLLSKESFSLTHYLVGNDNILRTPLEANNSEAVLTQRIDTEQTALWQHEHSSTASRKLHPDDEIEPAFQYIGPRGEDVIGVHQNIHIKEVRWAMISEIPRQDALASAEKLSDISLFLFLLTAAFVTSIALYQSHHITQPIIQLAKASMDVAAGERDKQVIIHANNEIGRLAESFNHMLTMRHIQEQAYIESNNEKKEALENLAEQQFALDQHANVSITDIKGRITFINKRFCEISGYSSKELLGRSHHLIKSGYHDKKFYTALYQEISAGNVWQGEFCNRAKDGHLFWVDTTIVPFLDEEGKPKSYISIRTDITAKKMGEFALKEALEAAESANIAKSEFLANMSHEIRTPMNGVIGMTNLLLDTPLSSHQQQQALTIKRSGESLLTIINDILDFSKIEAGKLNLERLDFDLDAMLDDLAHTLIFRSEEKGLSLHCPTNPKEGRWYKGDEGRIRQILINLLGNAIKFTEQGRVDLTYQSSKSEQGNTQLLFTIIDTGIGLSDEQQETLFDRFTQADGSTTRKFGGTGLGLSISKQLVELMGGEIGVKSELGVGTTFWFTLYLEEVSASEEAPRLSGTSTPPSATFNAHILVVDDNTTNQLVASGMLKKFGITTDIATNGQEAITALKQGSYDLVFMDCQMPVMDGYQATKVIRDPHSQVNNHQIPIVAMTANAMQGDREKCLAAGMDDHIAKPIDPQKLHQALDEWLPSNSKQIAKSGEDASAPSIEVNGTEEEVFDYAAMSQRLMGDHSLMQTISSTFLSDMEIQLKALEVAITTDNAVSITASAHKIKGAAANVGGMALSQIAQAIEQASQSGEMTLVITEQAKIEHAFFQLKSAMEEKLACNNRGQTTV